MLSRYALFALPLALATPALAASGFAVDPQWGIQSDGLNYPNCTQFKTLDNDGIMYTIGNDAAGYAQVLINLNNSLTGLPIIFSTFVTAPLPLSSVASAAMAPGGAFHREECPTDDATHLGVYSVR
jgi:hypothetical protein